jgi:hypothetical protein
MTTHMKTTKLTPGAAKALWQKAYELLVSPGLDANDLKTMAQLFHACAEPNFERPMPQAVREKFKADLAATCIKNSAELPSAYEENPLDDDDKLDEVRRLVFGSAP